jgi:hypothetical protein
VIFTSGIGVGSRELGVAERANERNQATDDPNAQEQRDGAGILGYQLRRSKDAGTHNETDDERDGLEGCYGGPRGHADGLLEKAP